MKSLTVLILSFLILLTGCGDLKDKSVPDNQFESSKFKVSCEMDVDEFSQILHKNIGSQIKCLEENLNLFMRVVKTQRPGYLSRTSLVQFIEKNRQDITPEVLQALKSIFDLNFLFSGEDPEYISKKNVDELIKFVTVFNEEAAQNYELFENESVASYELHVNHRERVKSSSYAIINALPKIFSAGQGETPRKLDIQKLLDSFTTEDNEEQMGKVKKLLFIKKVLLGGNKSEISHTELSQLVKNFTKLLEIALDIVRYEYITLDQNSLLQLLKINLEGLKDIIFYGLLGNREQELMFDMDEAIDGVKLFLDKEDFDIDGNRRLIEEAKTLAMGGSASTIYGKELQKIVNDGLGLLQTGVLFHRMYKMFEIAMESPLPITFNFDDYRHTYPENQAELKHFERIVKKYRFFSGKFESPYFFDGFKRNADGIFEIALWEYVLNLIVKRYGSPSNGIGGYSIDQKQLKSLMTKFEDELVNLDLILPQRVGNTSDNISLLGSLFQYQSDNNKVLDVNEASEFAVILLTSMDMSKKLLTYFKEEGCPIDKFDRVDPVCFKANFFQGYCKYYYSYAPKLFEYLGAKKCDELKNSKHNMAFLERSSGAARACSNYTDGAKEEIPYSEGDMMTILVAILSAETTILRWDLNRNNYLDPSEVESAYSIYSTALDGFLTDKPSIVRKFKKQIYQYLIKYEEVPDEKNYDSMKKFFGFLLSPNKAAPASRKTITSVLKAIADQNAKQNVSTFNCNFLRDPENIPRTPRPMVSGSQESSEDYSDMLDGIDETRLPE